MEFSKKGFELLTYIDKNGRRPQHDLAKELEISVGSINRLMQDYTAEGLIDNAGLTAKAYEALEPYRVKRAIILAAGFSERLAPITLTTPKPLVQIKGKRIIDTIIDALIDAEIKDITVVTGYKAEQFDELKKKYPSVQLKVNELYNQSGNITTLFCAKDKIDSCYICDADLYVHNPTIINKYEYSSCFFGVPVRETDDWCFEMAGKHISRFGIGGDKCYKAIFITYLNAADSMKCQAGLEKMISSRGGKERHWFDVLFQKGNKYKIEAKNCYMDDVTEIDTIGDLVKLDESYFGSKL